MKRKAISVILILLLACSMLMLTGCGEDKNNVNNGDLNQVPEHSDDSAKDDSAKDNNAGKHSDGKLDKDADDIMDDIEDGVDDIGDGIRDGAEDMKNGVEDAMDGNDKDTGRRTN